MEYLQILISSILIVFILPLSSVLWRYLSHYNNGGFSPLPINFPIFGTILNLILQLHRIPDYTTQVLKQTQGTFSFKGPWFSKIEILMTADPANVQYIMSKHHEDFHRGAKYQEKLQIFGDGLLIADSDKWKYQRMIAKSSFTSTRFRRFMVETLQDMLEKRLLPFLDHCHKEGLVIEPLDLFTRLATDLYFKTLIGYDTDYLSLNPSSHSIGILSTHDANDVMLARHVLPEFIWKLQRRLGIGKERKNTEYTQALNDFTYEMIKKKRNEALQRTKGSATMGATTGDDSARAIDLISLYMEENYGASPDLGFKSTDVFLRDTFVNFLLPGKEPVSPALTWLFWLLTKHPHVEDKIKEEIIHENSIEGFDLSQLGNSNKLVYLHATICESLRLYPSLPFMTRASHKIETLPTGHQVKPWTVIVLAVYAMGRMKWVWGEDCEEFKPERWITEKGTIKHEPFHKFCTFNTGPNICLGKDIVFLQMKAVAHLLISNGYRFEVVDDGHQVEPGSSIIIRMKHKLKVKVMKNTGIQLPN